MAERKNKNPSEDASVSKNLKTTPQNFEAENIGRNNPPIAVAHKKKWGEYLLEFLMLFLAVFLGFVADNFREHQAEKSRGKQYIESFCNDLISDTVSFSNLIAYNDEKIEGLKQMFDCYDSILKQPESASCLINILEHSRGNRGINFIDGTMQQLKNAGGFRVLYKDDRDSIITYDKAVQSYMTFQTTALQKSQDDVRSTAGMITNFIANKFLFNGSMEMDSSTIDFPLLFSNDKVLLNKYFNELFRYKNMTERQQINVLALKERAVRLIKFFKDKYHFQ